MTPLLATLREEFEAKLLTIKNTVQRDTLFRAIAHKISVFIGMRRTGKTVFLFQKMDELIQQGISLSQILYINFEDDRLIGPEGHLLVQLVDAFYSAFPENHDKPCYLFFDEIQNIPQWPLIIRRFFDTKKVAIYLTGSSAKLLSKEIATQLRGRSIATEVWPFNFHEYLVAKEASFPSLPLGQKAYDTFFKKLKDFLLEGGFPEITLIFKDNHRQILQDYVDVVIMRDIIERYDISNVTLIRYLIKSLLKNIGSPFSINKLSNDLKSQGMSISKNTLYDYAQYLEDAFLIFMVPIYTESLRKMQANPKKVYAIDTGLIHAYSLSSDNFGHLFENLIYLDLRRTKHEIFYFITTEGFEIDFLTKDKQGKIHLWQVAWDTLNAKTLAREERALHAAEKELKIKGRLITPETYIDFLTYINQS